MKLPFSWLKLVSLLEFDFNCQLDNVINLTTLPGVKQNIFLISFAKELYYTVAATLLYVLAWIALLAGYGWCAGTGICDARIAAGVSNLGL